MSFLSILLVASAFYFAHARPDSQSWSELYVEKPTKDTTAPNTDPEDYQHQLYGFVNDLSDALDKYMTPLMSKLDENKQDELKNETLNGFVSYANYMLLLIEEIENEKGDSQTQGDSYPRNEVILQFESLSQLGPYTPFIAATESDDGDV